MWNVAIRFVVVALIAVGAVRIADWFAERPGTLVLDWLGYDVEIDVMAALTALLILQLSVLFVWGLVRRVFHVPSALSVFFDRRRKENLHEAVTRGIVAAGAGDLRLAGKYARRASGLAGDDPLVQLLEAQTARLRGDRDAENRVFESMADSGETEILGLRGLFNMARQDGDMGKVRAVAERALELNPGVAWASKAMLALQSAAGEWVAASVTLGSQRSSGLLSKDRESRLQAVVRTAQAAELEESRPDEALSLAERALKSAPGLVPAAVIAGRILSARNNIRKAARILEQAWKRSPHPDIAEVYAYLRPGDSPQDRRQRVETLVGRHGGGLEGAIALAAACIDVGDWKEARAALAEHVRDRPQVRVCELMAEIERGEFGDGGRSREWLSRAVRAPRDPAWIADGHVSGVWLPVSPVTGELDAFEWTTPMEGLPRNEASDDGTAGTEPVVVENVEEDDAGPEIEPVDAEEKAEPADAEESGSRPRRAGEPSAETADKSSADGGRTGKERAEENAIDPIGMHRPDDPGPRKAKKSSADDGNSWYRGKFSR